MSEVRLALRDLVGVVREHVVDAAAVDVQRLAQVFHGDARTFDVPAGVSHPPRAVPFERLILEFGFGEPQNKVVFVALVLVLFHPFAHAHFKVVLFEVEKDVVLPDFGRIEIDVAARLVGEALFFERGDHADEFVHQSRGGLHDVRPLDVEFFAVGKKCVGIKGGKFAHRLALAFGAEQHFVLAAVRVVRKVPDVRDVHHALYVVAEVAQRLFEHVLHDIGAQVADVREIVHRRPAGIHAHFARFVRDKLLDLPGNRIINLHSHFFIYELILGSIPHFARFGKWSLYFPENLPPPRPKPTQKSTEIAASTPRNRPFGIAADGKTSPRTAAEPPQTGTPNPQKGAANGGGKAVFRLPARGRTVRKASGRIVRAGGRLLYRPAASATARTVDSTSNPSQSTVTSAYFSYSGTRSA